METETIQPGDYVTYTRAGNDTVAYWTEHGSGYVIREAGPHAWVIDRAGTEITVPKCMCMMRAKQYRLEV